MANIFSDIGKLVFEPSARGKADTEYRQASADLAKQKLSTSKQGMHQQVAQSYQQLGQMPPEQQGQMKGLLDNYWANQGVKPESLQLIQQGLIGGQGAFGGIPQAPEGTQVESVTQKQGEAPTYKFSATQEDENEIVKPSNLIQMKDENGEWANYEVYKDGSRKRISTSTPKQIKSLSVNVGGEKAPPQHIQQAIDQFVGVDQDLNAVQDMMEVGKGGPESVGLWDAAVMKFIKEPLGALTEQEQQFKQRYTALQRMIRILNGEARMSDQDYTRLKGALPGQILSDKVFRSAIVAMKADNEKKLGTKVRDMEDFGYIVPRSLERFTTTADSRKSKTSPVQSPSKKQTPKFKPGEQRRDKSGVMRKYIGNGKWKAVK